MPSWFFSFRPFTMAVCMVFLVEALAMLGLWLFRSFLSPRIRVHDGVNDAISGTVQAIGVFYGVTVGLLAIGVWGTWTTAADLTTTEATALGALYHDVSAFPEPARERLRQALRDYTLSIVQVEWPAQKRGEAPPTQTPVLDAFERELMGFEPATQGQDARYRETLAAYNRVVQLRGQRLDARNSGLTDAMWGVIWLGAAISIGISYFFHLHDWKLHAALVGMIAGFLALVLFLIVVNDRPYFGTVTVTSASYQLVLDTTMRL